jgi:hypothetical protein
MPAGTVIDAHRRSILEAWGVRGGPAEGASVPEPPAALAVESGESKNDLLALSEARDHSHPALLELSMSWDAQWRSWSD